MKILVSEGSRFLKFLYELTDLMLTLVKDWRRLKEKYNKELQAFSDPTQMSKIMQDLTDEEAGKVLKAFLELSSIATRFSKMSELEIDELRDLEKTLDNILKRLSAFSKNVPQDS